MQKHVLLFLVIILQAFFSCSANQGARSEKQTNGEKESSLAESPETVSQSDSPSSIFDVLDSLYVRSRNYFVDPEDVLRAKGTALQIVNIVLDGATDIKEQDIPTLLTKSVQIQNEFDVMDLGETIGYHLMNVFYPQNHECGQFGDYFELALFMNKHNGKCDSIKVVLPLYCSRKDMPLQFFLSFGDHHDSQLGGCECKDLRFEEASDSWIGRFNGAIFEEMMKSRVLYLSTVEGSNDTMESSCINLDVLKKQMQK